MWLSTMYLGMFMTFLMFAEGITDCKVTVHEPWPIPYIFVPRDSSVIINCEDVSGTSDPDFFWAIDLSDDMTNFALRFISTGENTTLNAHGVYELPPIETPGMPTTLRLLINDTARNNGTVINCGSVTSARSTTMFVLVLIPVTLEVMKTGENSINISWHQDSRQVAISDAVQTFSLTVSHGSSSQVISLNNSFYCFTAAPEDASPCEVYNFSITATYVGATYTGAGCSAPGSKSTMLPSLPDIVSLESSLEYVLTKYYSEITLVASFIPAFHCEQYPVLNYTLEVKGPSSDVLSQSVSPGVENVIHNLTENTIYSFRLLVSNGVGVVSTNIRQIFTTDVQNVTATLIETMNGFVVQCDFITGSNAQGCLVVLVGEFDNVTANLSILKQNISYSLSCYHVIYAFDIESDGSVGTLAVPGVIVLRNSETSSCLSATTRATNTVSTSSSYKTLIISVTVSVVVLAVFISMLVVVIIAYYKFRCCSTVNSTTIQMKPNDVYGIVTTVNDGKEIVTTPNEVYGISLAAQVP